MLPKVLRLKLVILNTDDDCLDAVDVVGEDAAGAVLVVVQRVRRGLDLNSRTETLQVGQRLPRLKLNLLLNGFTESCRSKAYISCGTQYSNHLNTRLIQYSNSKE